MGTNHEITSSRADSEARSLRLILVEDSEADAYLVGEAARALQYDLEVQRFATAAEAITGIEAGISENMQGVLLDLNLPAGSGLDVLRSIRGNERTRDLRVVVMTSSISARDREAAERLGVEGYLLKENTFEQFVATFGSAVRLIIDDRSQLA